MDYLDNDYENLLSIIDNKNVILKFYASWCTNCNIINDCIQDYSLKNKYFVINIDIDINSSLVEHYDIEKIPTVIKINNNELEKYSGASNILNNFTINNSLDINEDF